MWSRLKIEVNKSNTNDPVLPIKGQKNMQRQGLPRILAGERIAKADFAFFGHG
jgi:hypothetical protein